MEKNPNVPDKVREQRGACYEITNAGREMVTAREI